MYNPLQSTDIICLKEVFQCSMLYTLNFYFLLILKWRQKPKGQWIHLASYFFHLTTATPAQFTKAAVCSRLNILLLQIFMKVQLNWQLILILTFQLCSCFSEILASVPNPGFTFMSALQGQLFKCVYIKT